MVSFPSVRARINESLMARFKIQSIRAAREIAENYNVLPKLYEENRAIHFYFVANVII